MNKGHLLVNGVVPYTEGSLDVGDETEDQEHD